MVWDYLRGQLRLQPIGNDWLLLDMNQTEWLWEGNNGNVHCTMVDGTMEDHEEWAPSAFIPTYSLPHPPSGPAPSQPVKRITKKTMPAERDHCYERKCSHKGKTTYGRTIYGSAFWNFQTGSGFFRIRSLQLLVFSSSTPFLYP